MAVQAKSQGLVSLDLAYALVVTNRRSPASDGHWNTLWLSTNFSF
jgi:hypothetical protein